MSSTGHIKNMINKLQRQRDGCEDRLLHINNELNYYFRKLKQYEKQISNNKKKGGEKYGKNY